MFNNNTENDPLWETLQQAFSPDEAIFFRAYPLKVDGTIRELDYLVVHRNRTVTVILTETYSPDEIIAWSDGGITSFEPLLGETRTYYPASLAKAFLSTIHDLLLRADITNYRELTVCWLPHILSSDSLFEQNLKEDNPRRDAMYFLYEDTLQNIVSIISSGTQSQFSGREMNRLKLQLNPPSPITTRTPRLSHSEQWVKGRELSRRYIANTGKKTLIFLSYRRDDAGWAAGRIYGHLHPIFDGNIFFDYDSIKAGVDWRDSIDQALNECIIQLVVMGSKWALLKRRGAIQSRILEPGDMVAYEIRTGFSRKKVSTVPLLIDSARMPRRNELPYGVKQLPTRNAVLLNQDNFFSKMDVLTDRIIELLEMALK